MSAYEASVQQEFQAAHALPLPDGRREQSHKHAWRVTATFRAERLDPVTGVVIDFLAAAEAVKAVTDELAGKDLNALEAFADGRPSAERLAEHLARRLMARLTDCPLHRVAVTEAPGFAASFLPHVGA